ncbi:MAG: phosphoribosylanthranilate isomerase [Bacteroidales bacterium]
MKGSVLIKICGMRETANLEDVCALNPDLVGFIYVPSSRRYVGSRPDPALFRLPGPGIGKVGVFVDAPREEVMRIANRDQLDFIQLHGKENPDFCRELCVGGLSVIKVLNPFDPEAAGSPEAYAPWIRYFLFDTPGPGHGGTGQIFDWDLLQEVSLPRPFFLSGGIGPDSLSSLQSFGHPNLAGLDVNSRFETSPGRKDVGRLREFIHQIRQF